MGICGENICRLCSSESLNSVKIFSENDNGLTNAGRMILDCILPEVEPNGYPDIVCNMCNLQLNVFYEFKKKALEHHKRFTELINNHNQLIQKTQNNDQLSYREPEQLDKKHLSIKFPKEKDSEESNIYEEITSYLKQEQIEDEVLDEAPADEEEESEEAESEKAVSEKEETEKEIGENEEEVEERLEEERIDEEDDDNDNLLIKLETPVYLDDLVAIDSDENSEDAVYLESEFDVQFLDDEEIDTKTEYLKEEYIDAKIEQLENESIEILPYSLKRRHCNKAESQFDYDDDNLDEMEVEMLESASDNESMLKVMSTTRKRKKPAETNYECVHCHDVFHSLGEYRKHAKTHRPSKICQICDLTTFDIEKHLKTHGVALPDCYKCSVCGKEFTTALQCEVHEYRHTNVRPFPCTLCDKSFKLKCDLHVHMMCHNDIRKHVCTICGKSYRMLSHLKVHQETHYPKNSFQCDVCLQYFKTSRTLQSHKLQVHATTHKYKCVVCERGFYKKDKFKRHMNTHSKHKTTELPSSIHQSGLGRSFRMMSHLKGHVETHNTENKLKCEQCEKLFKTSGSLKCHIMQVHLKSAQFVCDICNKGFCRKDKMQRHRLTHSKKEKGERRN